MNCIKGTWFANSFLRHPSVKGRVNVTFVVGQGKPLKRTVEYQKR